MGPPSLLFLHQSPNLDRSRVPEPKNNWIMNLQTYCTTNQSYGFPRKPTAGALFLAALLGASWLHATGVPVQLRHQPAPVAPAGTAATVQFNQLSALQLEAETQRLERAPRLRQLSLRECQAAGNSAAELVERVGGSERPVHPSP